jgi:hypothetical protein
MSRLSGIRPTPALIVAVVALVVAMSGAAVALPGKGQVKGNDIAKGAVKANSIAKGAVGSKQIKGKSIRGNRLKDGAIRHKQLGAGAVTSVKLLDAAVITAKILDGAITGDKIADAAITAAKIADGTITSQQVAEGGLDSSNLSDLAVLSTENGGPVRLAATEGASEAAARDAAPESTLFEKGDLTITAKCFRDTVADQTFAEIYAKTAADGAILDAEDDLGGGAVAADFLNTDTALVDSEVDSVSVTGADADLEEGEFAVVGPDGTHLVGQVTVAAKNGVLATDGVYGEGNVCLFGGEIAG